MANGDYYEMSIATPAQLAETAAMLGGAYTPSPGASYAEQVSAGIATVSNLYGEVSAAQPVIYPATTPSTPSLTAIGTTIKGQTNTAQVAEAGIGVGALTGISTVVGYLLKYIPQLGALIAANPALSALLGGGAAALGGAGLVNYLFGTETVQTNGGTLTLGGAGLKEPVAVKQWVANNAQFYLLADGRIAVYSRKTGKWKTYRPQKMAVIGKTMPSHRMITRLRRNLKKHTADDRTILGITSPKSLRVARRHFSYHRRGR